MEINFKKLQVIAIIQFILFWYKFSEILCHLIIGVSNKIEKHLVHVDIIEFSRNFVITGLIFFFPYLVPNGTAPLESKEYTVKSCKDEMWLYRIIVHLNCFQVVFSEVAVSVTGINGGSGFK